MTGEQAFLKETTVKPVKNYYQQFIYRKQVVNRVTFNRTPLCRLYRNSLERLLPEDCIADVVLWNTFSP